MGIYNLLKNNLKFKDKHQLLTTVSVTDWLYKQKTIFNDSKELEPSPTYFTQYVVKNRSINCIYLYEYNTLEPS